MPESIFLVQFGVAFAKVSLRSVDQCFKRRGAFHRLFERGFEENRLLLKDAFLKTMFGTPAWARGRSEPVDLQRLAIEYSQPSAVPGGRQLLKTMKSGFLSDFSHRTRSVGVT